MTGTALKSILVIRRDNIGDLLCTTPLLSALRRRHANAWIGALTNSYAAPILAGNPDIDQVFIYDKGKHLDSWSARIRALARRIALVLALRERHIDIALLPASGHQRSAERFARLSGAKTIIRADDLPADGPHEVEHAFSCSRALGVAEPPPPMVLHPDASLVERMRSRVPPGNGPVIGLHISARKPSQRWPVERFAALAHSLHERYNAQFLIFWAPGRADDRRHPGDDEKTAELMQRMTNLMATALPTKELPELIAGLSLCDQVICSDGGAMHIAAALGKPIVCFFGDSDAARWHPWYVPHELLQPTRRNVVDITLDETVFAYDRLSQRKAD